MFKIIILLLSFSVVAADDAKAQVDTSNPKTARDYYERGLRREKAKKIAGALADYQKAGELDRHFSTHTFLKARFSRR